MVHLVLRKEVKQQLSGRIPSDAVSKILMQKVRSMELSLSVLEEYVEELNRRYGDILPDLHKELSQNGLLLEDKIRSQRSYGMEGIEVCEYHVAKLDFHFLPMPQLHSVL